ncbi:MAG: hypothetical protein AAFW69_06840 [Pseudomonadota bacterium]
MKMSLITPTAVLGAVLALPATAAPVMLDHAAAPSCDALAAIEGDPQARAAPVADAALRADAIISACRRAWADQPNTGRIATQLARGFLARGDVAEAVFALGRGMEGGHGAAFALLGGLYRDGAGVPQDDMMAHYLYDRAFRLGFMPAMTALVALYEDPESLYHDPYRAAWARRTFAEILPGDG